jgi:hypothetical protein
LYKDKRFTHVFGSCFGTFKRKLRNSRIQPLDVLGRGHELMHRHEQSTEYEIMSPIPPICQLRANSPVAKSSIKPRFRDAIEAVVAGYVLRDVSGWKIRLTRQPLRHLQAIKILDWHPRKHATRRHASLAALFQSVGFPAPSLVSSFRSASTHLKRLTPVHWR